MYEYQDNYCAVFSGAEELQKAIDARDDATIRIPFDAKDITIWAGELSESGDSVNLRRIGDNAVVMTKTIKTQHASAAILHTATRDNIVEGGTQLFLGYKGKAKMEFIPISAAAKVSIVNRGRASVSGELNEAFFGINTMALARVFEDSIKKHTDKVLCIVVYGKIIGIMSDRYCPTPQGELTNTVFRVLSERYPYAEIISGTLSNRINTVDFNLHETVIDNGVKMEILTTLLNSDNGHSAVRLLPRCRIDGRSNVYAFADDEWASNHISLTMEDIEQGADTMFLRLRDTLVLVSEAENYQLQHPYAYASSVMLQLNKLATAKGGTKIPQNMMKDVLGCIESFIAMGIKTEYTVMDIADRIIDAIPNDVGENYKSSIMKTLMRILHLKHAEYDKVQ